MTSARFLTGIISAVLCLTFASTARADRVHEERDLLLERLIFAERHHLTVFTNQAGDTGYLYAGHFENNNGKHLGFSLSAVNRGPKLGIIRPQLPSQAAPSQNPEPTAMVLLGTGLAAAAAFARKLNRRRG